MPPSDATTVRVCPNCGFSHLRASRPHSPLEQAQAWWSRTGWFRCQTCKWRGRLRDVWDADSAFPDLPPLRLSRDLDIDALQERDEQSVVEIVLARHRELAGALRIWLDDSRPAPPGGWLRVTTVESAKRLLEAGLVAEISLDYDLGWCPECLHRGDHLKHSGLRHCPHMPTGYDLVVWMSQTGHWPTLPPTVHSGNVEGGARMLGAIVRSWPENRRATSEAPALDTTHDAPAPAPSEEGGDSSAVVALTTCPKCGGPHLYRTHRRSNLERLRTLVTKRYPVRCDACGWAEWSREPLLVRVSAGAEAPHGPLDSSQIDRIDHDL